MTERAATAAACLHHHAFGWATQQDVTMLCRCRARTCCLGLSWSPHLPLGGQHSKISPVGHPEAPACAAAAPGLTTAPRAAMVPCSDSGLHMALGPQQALMVGAVHAWVPAGGSVHSGLAHVLDWVSLRCMLGTRLLVVRADWGTSTASSTTMEMTCMHWTGKQACNAERQAQQQKQQVAGLNVTSPC